MIKLTTILLLLATSCSSNEVETWVRQGLESKRAINDAALDRVKKETRKVGEIIKDEDEDDDEE